MNNLADDILNRLKQYKNRLPFLSVRFDRLLISWHSFRLMKCSPLPLEIDERNQLIDDFLLSARGEEVHYTDIAWFLRLDPFYVNYWMKKHNRGNWINGKSPFWWKWQNDTLQKER